MVRPEKIYLDTPINLEGHEIKCTRDGLVFLIDHYEYVLANIKPEQISVPDLEFAKQRIEEFKWYVVLYDRNREDQADQGTKVQSGV